MPATRGGQGGRPPGRNFCGLSRLPDHPPPAPERPALWRLAPCRLQVSNQFVSQFYTVLHTSPRNLHRFYSEASTLTLADTRPDGQHIFKTVTGQKVRRRGEKGAGGCCGGGSKGMYRFGQALAVLRCACCPPHRASALPRCATLPFWLCSLPHWPAAPSAESRASMRW